MADSPVHLLLYAPDKPAPVTVRRTWCGWPVERVQRAHYGTPAGAEQLGRVCKRCERARAKHLRESGR